NACAGHGACYTANNRADRTADRADRRACRRAGKPAGRRSDLAALIPLRAWAVHIAATTHRGVRAVGAACDIAGADVGGLGKACRARLARDLLHVDIRAAHTILDILGALLDLLADDDLFDDARFLLD